ncbi:MAG: hypothetical protein FD129_1740, partial [bacterium]
ASTANEARSNDESARDVAADKSKADEMSSAAPPTDPDYAMVFAAASRAREAGLQSLAQRGFALVREGIPDDDLAREAEYEEILAGARMEIVAGTDPAVVSKKLEGNAATSWAAVVPGEKPTCRKALAALRAAITMAGELGRPYAPNDADARLAQRRSRRLNGRWLPATPGATRSSGSSVGRERMSSWPTRPRCGSWPPGSTEPDAWLFSCGIAPTSIGSMRGPPTARRPASRPISPRWNTRCWTPID